MRELITDSLDDFMELTSEELHGTDGLVQLEYGQEIDSKYLIHHRIGAGGQAQVFEATDLVRGGLVAIKAAHVASDEELDRVKREASLQAILSFEYDGVVPVLDVGISRDTDTDFVYIALEYMPGGNLGNALRSRQEVAFKGLVNVIRPAFHAVEIAHEANIVHRDIKEQNILIDENGAGKLCDFGIAKARDANDDFLVNYHVPVELACQDLTATNGPVGTLTYAPPEFLLEGKPYTERGDVFAAGITLYKSLVGHHPWGEYISTTQYLSNLEAYSPTSLEFYDGQAARLLGDLVMSCIEKDAANRPTMHEVVETLTCL